MARQISKALIILLVAGSYFGLPSRAQDDTKNSGPLSLVIQYSVAPAQRARFREHLEKEGLEYLSRLKTDGVLSDYHLLFSRYVDNASWDALSLLEFPNYDAVARWKRVESSTPAGLPQTALDLTESIGTYPVDLFRSAAAASAAPHAVFLVIPYTTSVSMTEYCKYADAYVRPQFEGWMKEGILNGYQMYLQRYTAGRPWDVLIFLRYIDDESFGQRERIVAKVRAELQSNPVWKAVSDNKQNVRVEHQAVIADELSSYR